eukprot:CAMPEP_0175936256 /NCGR_PEP_ID=MMETSP0108-20121206/21511_1 /TAXON_ID=195067 ORGANISM="Goniomonas pacifica, Strain CCMP1869" /NCGR_SAMPLE_ID=MMETSP0108 /ASSEMBLY_ACC=CAM_ASM_000204 /LENGTH=98 /DNA_ID=CAMNT_0017260319 /DNA_START=104 /DNA_END=398 /DNA_ORIENTATION=+
MLCEHGCDVNGDPTAAESPLQLALRSHRWDAVESLIKHGANPAGIQEDVSFETAPERIRTMLVRAEEEAAGMTKAAAAENNDNNELDYVLKVLMKGRT